MNIKDIEKKEKKRLEHNIQYAEKGVQFIDIRNTFIDDEVEIGEGTVIYPGTFLEGHVVIGSGCSIGPNCKITDCTIGDRTTVINAVMVDSQVGSDAQVGPFTWIRPNCLIGDGCRVGDFVEMKNSSLGDGSKSSHLTYIGDADVGTGVNIGCWVVFVNYNGSEKFRSTVGNNAFIGCNTNLVSPVSVGKGAYIGAGSTVTKDVPEDTLCVARAREKMVEGWVKKSGLLNKKKKK